MADSMESYKITYYGNVAAASVEAAEVGFSPDNQWIVFADAEGHLVSQIRAQDVQRVDRQVSPA